MLLEHVAAVGNSFAQDELAYLAMTSKVELPIRDRLAWSLHTVLWPDWIVAREWGRTDLAVLHASRPDEPALLLEAKAMYTFDEALTNKTRVYPAKVEADLKKVASRTLPDTLVFGLLLATHPHSPADPVLRRVVKYLPDVTRSSREFGLETVRTMAKASVREQLSRLGPVADGFLAAGEAFGVEVSIDYFLVGPVKDVT